METKYSLNYFSIRTSLISSNCAMSCTIVSLQYSLLSSCSFIACRESMSSSEPDSPIRPEIVSIHSFLNLLNRSFCFCSTFGCLKSMMSFTSYCSSSVRFAIFFSKSSDIASIDFLFSAIGDLCDSI